MEAAAGVGAGTGDKNTQKRTGSATLTTTMINRQYGTYLAADTSTISEPSLSSPTALLLENLQEMKQIVGLFSFMADNLKEKIFQ